MPRGKRRPFFRIAAAAFAAAAIASTSCPNGAFAAPVGGPPTSPSVAADAPWTKTVTWLVSQLTPAEELRLIEGSWANKGNTDSSKDPDGHNQAGYVQPVKRLGIPEARHADALGIEGFADSTAFPTRLGIAASFDRDALSLLGRTEGEEGIATKSTLLYGPQVDLARTPSWGRNMTAYSEDPYLASQLTLEEISNIQSTGLMSQVKHVSFYSGQSQTTPSIVDEQTAREFYLAPAETAVKDAKVSSMMCSYATFQIKGYQDTADYACSNSGLLNGIVKGEWNFPGWITTDYGASKATSDLLRGTDQEFRWTFLSEENLLKLIDPTSDAYDADYAAAADNASARIIYGYERFGLLDNDHIPAAFESDVPQHGDVDDPDNSIDVDKANGIKVARELSEKAATLLSNNGVLPLVKASTVALVGPTANLLPASPGGERAIGYGDRVNISAYDGAKAIAGSKVTYVPGIDNVGVTVPANALSVDADGVTPGLTRSTDNAGEVTTSNDTILDGRQVNLAKGSTFTWTGYVNVPADDTYRLLIQRPYGMDLGDDSKYNENIRNVSNSTLSFKVDGATKQMSNPDGKILQNAWPTFATGVAGVQTKADNGQYLGYENVATSMALTAGRHAIEITYAPKTTAATTPTLRFAWSAIAPAVEAAKTAAAANDVSVVFVDDNGARSGDGESAQTDVLRLSVAQEDLITSVTAAAHAAGKKAVVVLNVGTAVQMPWAGDVDAILNMWYPGQEGGTATARVLYGQVNPSGKLTLSFPTKSAETLFAGHPERAGGTQDAGETVKTIKWTEGLNVGYRWYASAENTQGFKPLFAFGHGLSYTTFGYSGLGVKTASNGGLNVSFTVKNTGSVDGADSPQVYLSPSTELPAGVEQPAIKLVQFDHIDLKAGESKTVTLNVAPRELSSWSVADQKWIMGTGARTLQVGAASDDLALKTTVNVHATVAAPSVTTQPVAASVKVGGTVTLTAAADGSPAPTVAWQVSTDGGTSWTAVPGATSTSYTFTAKGLDNGAQYRAVFANDLGDAVTNAAKVTVSKLATAVSAKMVDSRIKTRQYPKVKTVVTAPVGQVVSGQIEVRVTYRGKTYAKVTKFTRGQLTVTLPRLKKAHTYKVYVKYLGNSDLLGSQAKTLTLNVKK